MTTYDAGEHSSEKAGLPPGEMRYIGRQGEAAPRVTIIDYDAGHVESKELSSVSKAAAYKDKPTVTWINVSGVGDLGTLRKLGEAYDLHALARNLSALRASPASHAGRVTGPGWERHRLIRRARS